VYAITDNTDWVIGLWLLALLHSCSVLAKVLHKP